MAESHEVTNKKNIGCTQCLVPRIDHCVKWKDEYENTQTTYICQCGSAMFITLWAESPNTFELTAEIEESFR